MRKIGPAHRHRWSPVEPYGNDTIEHCQAKSCDYVRWTMGNWRLFKKGNAV